MKIIHRVRTPVQAIRSSFEIRRIIASLRFLLHVALPAEQLYRRQNPDSLQ